MVKDAMKKLLYADDLALVANGKQELQETMEEWNWLFARHRLTINLEKTEVIHIGHHFLRTAIFFRILLSIVFIFK